MRKIKDLIGVPISGEWGEDGGDVKVIRTTNFRNDGTLDLFNVVNRSIDSRKVENKRLQNGDIIIEKSVGSPTQPVGRVVFFDKTDTYLCNNFTSILRPNKNVFPKYLFWFLFSNHNKGITKKYQNKTTGIINLKLERYINDVSVNLPEIEVQEMISHELDVARDIGNIDREIEKKYDELAQAIFHETFGDLGKIDKVPLEAIVIKGRGMFSNGPFGSDLLTSELVSQGVPVIYIRDIRNGYFSWRSNVYVTPDKAKSLSACNVKHGDLLITKVGDPPGTAAIYRSQNEEAIITQDVIRLRTDPFRIVPEYLQYFLNSAMGKNSLKPIIVQGTRSRFSLNALKNVAIPVPRLEHQQKFADILEKVDKLRSESSRSLSEDLLGSLMNKYFNN